jgi:hypothetical protein
MGKSFNDDIFINSFNLDSINGLNISQEAINENKQAINLKINDDLSEAKKQFKKQQETKQDDIKATIEENIKVAQEISEKAEDKAREIQEQQETEEEPQKDNTIYTKKTMIFNQDYLDIIDGLAQNNDMQIKDVLNQLLGRAINQLDEKVRDKALKTGKKAKTSKTNKNIF